MELDGGLRPEVLARRTDDRHAWTWTRETTHINMNTRQLILPVLQWRRRDGQAGTTILWDTRSTVVVALPCTCKPSGGLQPPTLVTTIRSSRARDVHVTVSTTAIVTVRY